MPGSTRDVSADADDSSGDAAGKAPGAMDMSFFGIDFELGLFEVVVRGSSDLTARDLTMDFAARNSNLSTKRQPFAMRLYISRAKTKQCNWT